MTSGDIASGVSLLFLLKKKSVKLFWEMQGWPMIVLIDSGASHNFLSEELIQVLDISKNLPRQFQVMLGNGKTTPGQGMRCGVPFTIQGVNWLLIFYPSSREVQMLFWVCLGLHPWAGCIFIRINC